MNNKMNTIGNSIFSRSRVACCGKKGISAIVATVLIILITVAAVTIIWAAIIPMINDKLESGTVCLDAMTALNIENKGYTCYTPNTNVKVQVSHGSKDVGLVGIQVLVSDDIGETSSYKEENTDNLPGINEEAVITVAHTANVSTVRIAPIVRVGNSDEICDASSSVEVEVCN